jgi:hypothetical protein
MRFRNSELANFGHLMDVNCTHDDRPTLLQVVGNISVSVADTSILYLYSQFIDISPFDLAFFVGMSTASGEESSRYLYKERKK